MGRSVFCSSGMYLPAHIVTNAELEHKVDTNDAWIVSRTGIKQRHIADAEETTSFMAARAAADALKRADIDPETIDLVIVATTSPDRTFPSTATKVQALLGLKPVPAFDIQAVCAGFVYALSVADNFIRVGQAKRALVIGADKMSALVNWQDRSTCVLFGDGAGAVILEAAESDHDARGILSTKLLADGKLENLLYVNGGVATTGTVGSICMEGPEVFKHAVEKMSECIRVELAAHQLKIDDIDLLIPHQANIRILDAIAKKLDLPKEKVIVTVDSHANTSAASIPLALHNAWDAGRLKKGELAVLVAIGGGMCWGSCLVRW